MSPMQTSKHESRNLNGKSVNLYADTPTHRSINCSELDFEEVVNERPPARESECKSHLEGAVPARNRPPIRNSVNIRPPSRKKLPPGSQSGSYRKRNSVGDDLYESL